MILDDILRRCEEEIEKMRFKKYVEEILEMGMGVIESGMLTEIVETTMGGIGEEDMEPEVVVEERREVRMEKRAVLTERGRKSRRISLEDNSKRMEYAPQVDIVAIGQKKRGSRASKFGNCVVKLHEETN